MRLNSLKINAVGDSQPGPTPLRGFIRPIFWIEKVAGSLRHGRFLHGFGADVLNHGEVRPMKPLHLE